MHASLIAIISMLACAQDVREELLALLSRAVPAAGMVEAFFAATGGTTEHRVGVDFATGAWYLLTPQHMQIRQPDGWYFENGMSAHERPPIMRERASMVVLASFIPTTMAVFLLDHPEVIKNVRRDGDLFLVDVEDQREVSTRVVPPMQVAIDSSGRLLHVVRADRPVPARITDVRYSSDAPGGAHVAAEIPRTSLRLRGIETPLEAGDRFTTGRAEALWSLLRLNDAKVKPDRQVAFIRLGTGPLGRGCRQGRAISLGTTIPGRIWNGRGCVSRRDRGLAMEASHLRNTVTSLGRT